jgi:hypothetical protein
LSKNEPPKSECAAECGILLSRARKNPTHTLDTRQFELADASVPHGGPTEAATAALDALRAEFEARGVAVKDGSWGYRLLVVDDLDGNQLLFNYPNENAAG